MKRLLVHAQVHAREYIVPLVLLVVLSAGAGGLVYSDIPLERIKEKALSTFIMVAQAMTKTDPRQQSNELIKMEGRRRKADWKETHEVMAWNHRLFEEGRKGKPKPDKWLVCPPMGAKRKVRCNSILIESEHNVQLATIGITVGTILFSYYFTQHFLYKLGNEVIKYWQLHGAL